MRLLQRRFRFGLVASLLAATVVVFSAQDRAKSEWRYFGGDKGFTRYSSLDQINSANVKSLRIAWRRPATNDDLTKAFPSLRTNAYLRATPIVVGGVLYTQDAYGQIVAIDGATGRTLWIEASSAATQDEANGGRSTRGVDYWQGGAERRQAHHRHPRRVPLRGRRRHRHAGT